MPKYETTAGYVTRADTYAQLIEKLRELEELFYVMGHLHALQDTEHDRLLGHGWRGMGQLMKRVHSNVIVLAQGRFQQ